MDGSLALKEITRRELLPPTIIHNNTNTNTKVIQTVTDTRLKPHKKLNVREKTISKKGKGKQLGTSWKGIKKGKPIRKKKFQFKTPIA